MKLLHEYKKYGPPSWFPRFVKKINENGPIQPHMDTPCMIWMASKNTGGYGVFCVPGGRDRAAHRIAYRLAYGVIPVDRLVCHQCDVPACVNAEHLFLGTHTKNMWDAEKKGRKHPFGRLSNKYYEPDELRTTRDDQDWFDTYKEFDKLRREEEE